MTEQPIKRRPNRAKARLLKRDAMISSMREQAAQEALYMPDPKQDEQSQLRQKLDSLNLQEIDVSIVSGCMGTNERLKQMVIVYILLFPSMSTKITWI